MKVDAKKILEQTTGKGTVELLWGLSITFFLFENLSVLSKVDDAVRRFLFIIYFHKISRASVRSQGGCS